MKQLTIWIILCAIGAPASFAEIPNPDVPVVINESFDGKTVTVGLGQTIAFEMGRTCSTSGSYPSTDEDMLKPTSRYRDLTTYSVMVYNFRVMRCGETELAALEPDFFPDAMTGNVRTVYKVRINVQCEPVPPAPVPPQPEAPIALTPADNGTVRDFPVGQKLTLWVGKDLWANSIYPSFDEKVLRLTSHYAENGGVRLIYNFETIAPGNTQFAVKALNFCGDGPFDERNIFSMTILAH